MKVSDLCTRQVRGCGPDTNLAAAGASLWEADCGGLPVVDSSGKAIGVITDRDICIAISTKSTPACEIPVSQVMSGHTFSCKLEDDIHDALETMRAEKVRRLPVLDEDDKVQGILSLNDIILAATPKAGGKRGQVTHDEVVATLQAISAHRPREAARVAEPSEVA